MSAPALHLSRASLRADASVRALAPLLLPDDDDARVAAAHRFVWSLFADSADRTRDFLWREEKPGRYLVLSQRAPVDARDLFDIETKPFVPAMAVGERLAFALRANPTVAAPGGKGQRGRPVDVLMHALRDTPGRRGPDGRMLRPLEPGAGRAFVREAVLGWLDGADEETRAKADPRRPALDWLARRGAVCGFDLDRDATRVIAYRRVALPRSRGRPVVFGQVDYEGALTVRDPAAFRAALRDGFGRAKAFGCGLMLLARAAPDRDA